MKHYQDSDPLHGNGKAMPKPKAPNPVPMISRCIVEHLQPRTGKRAHSPLTRRQKTEIRRKNKREMRKAMAAMPA